MEEIAQAQRTDAEARRCADDELAMLGAEAARLRVAHATHAGACEEHVRARRAHELRNERSCAILSGSTRRRRRRRARRRTRTRTCAREHLVAVEAAHARG